jgi:hypothetical protein
MINVSHFNAALEKPQMETRQSKRPTAELSYSSISTVRQHSGEWAAVIKV